MRTLFAWLLMFSVAQGAVAQQSPIIGEVRHVQSGLADDNDPDNLMAEGQEWEHNHGKHNSKTLSIPNANDLLKVSVIRSRVPTETTTSSLPPSVADMNTLSSDSNPILLRSLKEESEVQ